MRKQAAENQQHGQYDQLKNDAMSYQDSHGQDFQLKNSQSVGKNQLLAHII